MKNWLRILVIFLILVGSGVGIVYSETTEEKLSDLDMVPYTVKGGVDIVLPGTGMYYIWNREQADEIYRIINDSVSLEEYNQTVGQIEDLHEIIVKRDSTIRDNEQSISFWKGLSIGTACTAVVTTLICIFGK